MQNQAKRQHGSALVLVIFLALALLAMTVTSLQLSRNQALAYTVSEADTSARGIVESALAIAVTSIRDGGIVEPHSGNGTTAAWVTFGDGEYFFESELSDDGSVNNVVVWSRVALSESPSASAVSPESTTWDGSGWLVRGLEVAIQNDRYIPNSPLYFGKGGIQAPLGGFAWSGSSDLDDPGSWNLVTSDPDSTQASSVPFSISALNHPADYLTSGDAPAAPETPHPFPILNSSNPIAQLNAEAWFRNSAGTGDATDGATPDLSLGYYESLDKDDPNYAFPVASDLPKVQSLGWSMWQKYSQEAGTNLLAGGNHSGTFGSLASPEVTFVTGGLTIPGGETLKGAGVLVIRDDYDPNVDSDNKPSTRAGLRVSGTLEWTGLVIVVGWNPSIRTDNGSKTTIVGALLGEDSVQSMGEPSLESSSIILTINGPLNVHYSRSMFQEDGQMHELMPDVERTIVAIRSRNAN